MTKSSMSKYFYMLGNRVIFRAGPLIDEYKYLVVGRKHFLYDAHQQPGSVAVATEVVSFRTTPLANPIKPHWITNYAILIPYYDFHTGIYNINPVMKNLQGLVFDEHNYIQGPVRGADLYVFGRTLAEAKTLTIRLIKSNVELKKLITATFNRVGYQK